MTTNTNPDRSAGPSARAEERAMLTVTCLAAFLFFNSFGSISMALPAIQKQFGNSLAEIQWVVLMGVVTISSLSLCFGRAGGIFGQRRLYKIGVLLYAIGAGFGAVSLSFRQLLSARAVMAIGLAMALPMSTAILASSFGAERRGQALGLFASAVAVGRSMGPTIGGFLLHWWGWPAIFWMNFLVGIIISAAVFKIFRGAGAQQKERFDFYGSAALLIGYPALLIGLTQMANATGSATAITGWFVVAVIGLASFVAIELRARRPLVDAAMFKNKPLAAALATVVLSYIVYNPIALCAPLYLQNVLHASPVATGLLLAILPVATALSSPVSGRLADRFEPAAVAAAGIALICAGIGYYAQLGAQASNWGVSAALVLIGMGVGFFTPANQKLAFASVPSQDYGVLGAMLSSLATAAGTVGTTIVVALMEMTSAGRSAQDPLIFSSAQEFAFLALLPLGIIAVIISIRSCSKVDRRRPFASNL
jgi:EmrB/QacA subfamily drug resistance transporter